MRILICDDEEIIVNTVENMLKNICYKKDTILKATSGAELLDLFYKSTYLINLILLDIKMEGLNGIELTKLIKEHSPRTIVILITRYENFALDGYKARAFNFLLKPINEEKLKVAVEESKQLIVEDDYFIVRLKKETTFLSVKDIFYIESYNRKIIYYTQNNSYETNEKFRNVIEKFESKGFCKAHKSYLVNLNYVDKVDKKSREVIICNQFKVPIGSRNIKNFVDKLVEVRRCL